MREIIPLDYFYPTDLDIPPEVQNALFDIYRTAIDKTRKWFLSTDIGLYNNPPKEWEIFKYTIDEYQITTA